MLGENELVKLFPDFKDLVQPSGIDLALDKIYTQESEGSLIDNEKNLPEIGDRVFKWYDSSVKSFMGSSDPYKVIGCTIKVENAVMLSAFKNTATSSNINLRYWSDYANILSI